MRRASVQESSDSRTGEYLFAAGGKLRQLTGLPVIDEALARYRVVTTLIGKASDLHNQGAEDGTLPMATNATDGHKMFENEMQACARWQNNRGYKPCVLHLSSDDATHQRKAVERLLAALNVEDKVAARGIGSHSKTDSNTFGSRQVTPRP